jgi:hypothetical protein
VNGLVSPAQRKGIGVREGLQHPWSMVLLPSEQRHAAACGFAVYGISFGKLIAWAQLTLAVQVYVREIQKRQGLAIGSWRGKLARYLKYASEASWRGTLIIELSNRW